MAEAEEHIKALARIWKRKRKRERGEKWEKEKRRR